MVCNCTSCVILDDLIIKLQFIVYLGQNKATTNERNEVFAVNTTDETQDASQTTAENEVSEIHFFRGARYVAHLVAATT